MAFGMAFRIPLFQCIQALLQGSKFGMHHVRVIALIQHFAFVHHFVAVDAHYAGGDADGGGVGGDIGKHHAVGADAAVFPNGDGPQHFAARANQHIVAHRGVAFALVLARAAQRNAVVNCDIVANFGRFAHHNARAVVDEKPVAYGGAGMDLNAGKAPAPLADGARQKKAPVAEQPVRDAVKNKRVEPRVQKHHFRKAAGRGVFFQHAFRI